MDFLKDEDIENNVLNSKNRIAKPRLGKYIITIYNSGHLAILLKIASKVRNWKNSHQKKHPSYFQFNIKIFFYKIF